MNSFHETGDSGMRGPRREMLARPASVFPQERQDADDGHRDGIGSERALAKRDEADASLIRALPLALVPPALRSDPHRRFGWNGLVLERGEWFDASVRVRFNEHQLQASARLVKKAVKAERCSNVWNDRPPRLFHRRHGNTAPAIQARRSEQCCDRRFGASGDER